MVDDINMYFDMYKQQKLEKASRITNKIGMKLEVPKVQLKSQLKLITTEADMNYTTQLIS